ncbi:hypothetical protein [Nonomuraea sp. NPDC002799]
MAFFKRRKISAALPEGYFDLLEEERLDWTRKLAEELKTERDRQQDEEE